MPVLVEKLVVALEKLFEVPTTTFAVVDLGVAVSAGVAVGTCVGRGGFAPWTTTTVACGATPGTASVGAGVLVAVGAPIAWFTLDRICENTTRLARKKPTVNTPRTKMLVKTGERL
jgi:hypothetical protein